MRESATSFLSTISKTYELKYNISDYFRYFAPELISALTASVEIAISACMEFEKTVDTMFLKPVKKKSFTKKAGK